MSMNLDRPIRDYREHHMNLQDGDVVIVVRADGRVQYWEQDTPEVLAYLERVEELSTCDCAHDQCPAEEMPEWREALAEGRY